MCLVKTLAVICSVEVLLLSWSFPLPLYWIDSAGFRRLTRFARQSKFIFADLRSYVHCKANSFLYVLSKKPFMLGPIIITIQQFNCFQRQRSTEIRQLSLSLLTWACQLSALNYNVLISVSNVTEFEFCVIFVCYILSISSTGSLSSVCERHNIDIHCVRSSTLIKYTERC